MWSKHGKLRKRRGREISRLYIKIIKGTKYGDIRKGNESMAAAPHGQSAVDARSARSPEAAPTAIGMSSVMRVQ